MVYSNIYIHVWYIRQATKCSKKETSPPWWTIKSTILVSTRYEQEAKRTRASSGQVCKRDWLVRTRSSRRDASRRGCSLTDASFTHQDDQNQSVFSAFPSWSLNQWLSTTSWQAMLVIVNDKDAGHVGIVDAASTKTTHHGGQSFQPSTEGGHKTTKYDWMNKWSCRLIDNDNELFKTHGWCHTQNVRVFVTYGYGWSFD